MPLLSQLGGIIQHQFTPVDGLKAIGAVVLWYLFKYRSNAIGCRRRTDLPGPKGLPLIGNYLLLSSIPNDRRIYEFFDRCYLKYGPVWCLTLPFLGRMIEADKPEILEHILRTNFWNYTKGPHMKEVLFDMTGTSVFTRDGLEWRHKRKIASHIFNVRAFREYISEAFIKEGQRLVNILNEAANSGEVVDLQDLFHRFTMDAFGRVSFTTDFGCLDSVGKSTHIQDFAHSFDDLTCICSERVTNPFWKITERLTGARKKVLKHKEIIRKFSESVIEKRQTEGFHGAHKDLLQILLDSRDEDGKPFSHNFIRDSIIGFALAGRDTVAEGMSWLFYEIFKKETDRSVEKRMREEIRTNLQGSFITYESHKLLKFNEACFLEALRLHPPVPRNNRYAEEDDVWPDGTKIYKGEWVTWSLWTIGRAKDIWGDDAELYNPDRWMSGEKPSQGKFPVFHGGPRVCLGQQFATIEVLTVLSLLLDKFTFELVEPDVEPVLLPSFTLPMANGLKTRVKHISPREP